MQKFIYAGLLMRLSAYSQAMQLAPADKQEILASTKNSCLSNQQKNPANANMTLGQIGEYCDCVAQRSASTITNQDVIAFRQQGDNTAVVAKMATAYSSCGYELMRKWGY